MNLNQRVAVITGAGSGIGRAIALALAHRGCRLALADINGSRLGETASMVNALCTHTSCHVLDVASRDAVAALPDAIAKAHGRVDLLINNAGVALGGTFEQINEADFDWLMSINFQGLVRMTRAFLPLLHASDEARIVNVSSLFGIITPPGQTAYCASKFAVRGFSNALRHELAGTRVGVTVVHPGGVDTRIASDARVPASATEQEVEAGRSALQKLLRMPPERAADIIVRGIEANRSRVLVGLDARVASWLERLFPVNYWRLLAASANL